MFIKYVYDHKNDVWIIKVGDDSFYLTGSGPKMVYLSIYLSIYLGSVEYVCFFAVYININILKCIKIALNTKSFMHIILVKKKQ